MIGGCRYNAVAVQTATSVSELKTTWMYEDDAAANKALRVLQAMDILSCVS